MALTDCAAAALTMVLRYKGINVTLLEVQHSLAPGRDGVSAAALVRLARSYGLRAKGIRCEPADLSSLPRGSILFWRFNHFLVLDRVSGTRLNVLDPSTGRRSIQSADSENAFTGIALVFEHGATRTAPLGPERPAFRATSLLHRERRLICRVVLTALMAQSLGVVVPLMTGMLTDRVIPTGDYPLLVILGLVFAASQATAAAVGLVRSHLLIYLKARLQHVLTTQFLHHLISLPYRFFQEHTSGDLHVRLASNDSVRDILTTTILAALVDGVTASVYLLVLVLCSIQLAIVTIVLAMLKVALLIPARSRQRSLFADMLENQAKSQTAQIELLSGIETLKSMGAEHVVARQWMNIFLRGLGISVSLGRVDAFVSLVLSAFAIASTLGLTFYGAILVIKGSLTLGTLIACTALASGFISPLNSLVLSGLQLQTLGVYLERIADVMNTPGEESAPPIERVSCGIRIRGAVELRSVSFRYTAVGAKVLDDISLSVCPGQRIAVTGPTGSGKSTLARLIAGLYNPESGVILMDGVDLRRLDGREFRSHIGVVTQDAQLFTGTIRSNITLNDPEIGLASVVFAATIASIHEDIMKMPLAYETPIVDRGLSLSGGERQRLAIARAVARRPKLLVLDEATSHVDGLTQERLKRNLASLSCTQIVIAHRLSTIRDADSILVLETGKAVAQGTHSTLMNQGGLYARLVELAGPDHTQRS